MLKKKLIAAALILTMSVGLFAGCTGGGTSSSTPDVVDSSEAPAASSSEVASSEGSADPAPTGEGITYPIPGGESLTYWVELNANVATNYTELGETPFAKALSEQTGVKVTYEHPAIGQADEQFNLMLASGDMPDIVEFKWTTKYLGGPPKAITDGVILDLTELINTNAPDLRDYLAANPHIQKAASTDDGKYFMFPFIRGDKALCASNGPMLRQDWLEELNLEVPKTIAEWEVVLTAFKEQKGATAPFSYAEWNKSNNPFLYANNTTDTWHLEGDKVVFGPITEGYKDYVALMADWYAKGLIDPDIATINSDMLDSRVTSGQSGAVVAYVGSGMGNWTKSGQAADEKFALVGAPNVTKDGGVAEFSFLDNQVQISGQAVITANAKNPEVAAQFLNYAYSPEGYNLYNFGVEGVSYTMENGAPTYTDLIMNNPDGLPVNQAMGGHIRAAYSGPMVQDLGYQNQYFQMDNQKEAATLWATSNMGTHLLPPITPTPEESDEFAPIMSEIETYVKEMTYKFMLGSEPIENFDKYVETINNMGIEKATEIQQGALNRYNAR